ncbi:MAG: M28 family peptidase, partial [Armatimonadota bacterium]|nr:M28 family peptidase [Armatimonadota bacterium]
MNIERSQDKTPLNHSDGVQKAIGAVSVARLRRSVEALAVPRHFTHEPEANKKARDWIAGELRGLGYTVAFQGKCDNVVAHPTHAKPGRTILLGAHYDSVPHCPGADDNASAVAVCLECAHVLHDLRPNPITVVLFNREEDGLLGSRDFVQNGLYTLP